MQIATDILIILLLIVVNGVFAMAEVAVITARKTRLHQQAMQGNRGAQAALELANAPNRFLSTVQIGITLVGILAGALGGATLGHALADAAASVPWLAPYSEALGLGTVVLVITYLSLVVGELVPKRFAMTHPERIAATVANPMHLLSRLAAPAVHLLSLSTELALHLLRIKPSGEPPITEEEVKHLLEQGAQSGVFVEAEEDMIRRVFRLNDLRVNMLMTPRTEIVWLDVDDSLAEVQRKINMSKHSRYPVCSDNQDNIVGIVRAKDLLARRLADEPFDLRGTLRRPLLVPENMPVLKLLEEFKQTGYHSALVVDEYGGLAGLVTINDILEAIVGDMPAVDQQEEALAVQREDGSWLLDGLLSIAEFKDMFRLSTLPGEEEGQYHTLGGFVMKSLGRIPTATDHFQWGSLRFEVMDMDGNRVDKVLVSPAPDVEDLP